MPSAVESGTGCFVLLSTIGDVNSTTGVCVAFPFVSSNTSVPIKLFVIKKPEKVPRPLLTIGSSLPITNFLTNL